MWRSTYRFTKFQHRNILKQVPAQQTGLEMKHRCYLQAGTKQTLLLEEASVFQCLQQEHTSDTSVVESGIPSAVISWGISIRASDLKKTNKKRRNS